MGAVAANFIESGVNQIFGDDTSTAEEVTIAKGSIMQHVTR